MLDDVDNLRDLACREPAADLVPDRVSLESRDEAGLTEVVVFDREVGGAALEARALGPASGLFSTTTFAFHICGFLLFALGPVVAGILFVGIGIFSSDFVLNLVMMFLKFGALAFDGFARTGDETLRGVGCCLYGET